MNKLEPLDIVDDRTPEQKMADGDWSNLPPTKLSKPAACVLHLYESGEWTGPAWWVCNGSSLCDEHIIEMLERLPDNREWLAPALADIRERYLKVGARVRIQMGKQAGNLGTVYNHLPSRPAPWHVRPDGWLDCAGVAYKADELDVLL